MSLRRFIPLFDRVLVRRVIPEAKTKGGILLPEQAQKMPNEGVVVATGKGLRTESGEFMPCAVKEGDKVLLPEFGGTKVTIDDQDLFLFRDSDILGTLE
ncbi:heat shock protein 10 [Salpingoeca rosetta]|uniref:Heat shock protein 10 n=1 Tax=Salpingoeca rosetta (strain ATCC 50818 / BSB-021) TaxID=946362 RepID=F2UC21_SALR5|nr:heat shock protein 10 [Salpingoeca rosetta]EGD74128.1 heat shock protein 10 [Salpingoeca rosetta]|eukprot:XP_004993029.1 heat shock protein 10 [Salpingoeca rosetta]